MNKNFKRGAIQGSTIAIILLALALIAAGSIGIWSFINYREAQTNLDGKIDLAVSEAEKKQADADETKFAEREKEPNYEFAGAADYGHVGFMYPKTWSAYVAADGSDGKDYFAYLHPVTVPPVPTSSKVQQRFALRVAIYNSPMDEVLKEYEKANLLLQARFHRQPQFITARTAPNLRAYSHFRAIKTTESEV